MDVFSTYHPIINFIYFFGIIGISMFFMHPVLTATALAAAVCYALYLKGRKALFVIGMGTLPVILLTGIINPIFSHVGATMLFYLKNGNPVTLESIVYGFASGFMISAVIHWFSCFHEVMTSDKIMYLFGKTIPAFSLLFSMTLRFVPRITSQMKRVSQAQQCIGRDLKNGSVMERAGHGMKIVSITATWALENSVETADSMKSRGYGLRGRTNYSVYRFDRRDRAMLLFLLACFGMIFTAIKMKWVRILYFPVFVINDMSPGVVFLYIAYGFLCFLPLLLNGKENLKWNYLRSRI